MWDFSSGNLIDRNVVTYAHDSTVCGITYRALKRNNTSWGQPDSSYWFVRNIGGKIYFTDYPTCADSGRLLFDFNLTPGDTFLMPNGIVDYVDTVAAVDFINLNGTMRKRIRFTSLYKVWIDGIGDSIRGLNYVPVGFEGAHYKLVCQYDSTGWMFSNNWGPFANDPLGNSHVCDSLPAPLNCALPTAVVGPTLDREELALYPNPALDYVSIRVKGSEAVLKASLYDVVGNMQYETNDGKIINVERLPHGLYVVKIETTNGIQWRKFVKQ